MKFSSTQSLKMIPFILAIEFSLKIKSSIQIAMNSMLAVTYFTIVARKTFFSLDSSQDFCPKSLRFIFDKKNLNLLIFFKNSESYNKYELNRTLNNIFESFRAMDIGYGYSM